MDQRTL